MTSNKLWLCVSLCFICFHGAGAFPYCIVSECVFNSTELQDMQYILSSMFNKEDVTRWDSRVEKFVGYTELGVKIAELWNKQPATLPRYLAALETMCKNNIELIYSNVRGRRVEPYVRLISEKPFDPPHTHMLVCSSYDFYPKGIKVTWLRDGEPATSDVTSTNEEPNGDWYYQYHSYLEYTPRSGEQISCKVEHFYLGVSGLATIHIVDWDDPDDSMPKADRNRIAMGAFGLVLGGVLFLSGFIYYRWKKHGHMWTMLYRHTNTSSGHVLVPTTEEMETAVTAL